MRSIIFDAESVRAILAKIKSQTRRIVKPQPPDDCGRIFGPEWYEPAVVDRHGEEVPGEPVYGIYDECGYWGTRCPLQPGDVVYVRETFGLPSDAWGLNPQMRIDIRYRADGERNDYMWRSPIHMPEWAARIHLEIVRVRAERLQEISEQDAMREGVVPLVGESYPPVNLYRIPFQRRWDEINARRGHSYASNPVVFVYELRKAKP